MRTKNLLSAGLLAALATGAQATFTFGAAGGAIPDNNTTGFSSSANVLVPVSSILSITLKGLTHTWVGDLIVTLTNPDNVSVDIFRRVGSTALAATGDSSNLSGDYKFTTGGASFWTAAAGGTSAFVIPVGTYAATTNAFTGVLATSEVQTNLNTLITTTAGNWTVKITDNAGADTGTFTSWEVEAVPEPASLVGLGLAVAAFARKRRS